MKDSKKIFQGLSADSPQRGTVSVTDTAVSATDIPLIIHTDTDKRIAKYLIDLYGKSRVIFAINQLAGNRKPYVSNIAKILGAKIPDCVINSTDKKHSVQNVEIARQNIDKIRQMLDN